MIGQIGLGESGGVIDCSLNLAVPLRIRLAGGNQAPNEVFLIIDLIDEIMKPG